MVETLYEPISNLECRVLRLRHTAEVGLEADHVTINLGGNRGILGQFWPTSPKYEALSYYWGDPTPTCDIHLNNTRIRIHDNLFQAQLVLVKLRPGILIWTDALCINQEDPDEKMSQISLMFDIYRNAQQVWAWLGIGCEGMSSLVSHLCLLLKIAKEIEQDFNYAKGTPEPRLPPIGAAFWKALWYVLENPYFERLWILQETAAARKVTFLIDTYRISFLQMEDLVYSENLIRRITGSYPYSGRIRPSNKAVFYMRRHGRPSWWGWLKRNFLLPFLRFWLREVCAQPLPPVGITTVDTFFERCRSIVVTSKNETVRTTFKFLIDVSSRQKCSEPKDRILSLLELWKMLVDPVMDLPWTPTQSMEQMYAETFHFLLPVINLPNLLILAPNEGSETIANLPSWCPEFGQNAREFNQTRKLGALKTDWCASPGSSVICRGQEPGTVHLKAVLVGKVKFASTQPWLELFPVTGQPAASTPAAANIHWLREVYHAIENRSTEQHDDSAAKMDNMTIDQFWRTVCIDGLVMSQSDLTIQDYSEAIQALLNSILWNGDAAAYQPLTNISRTVDILTHLNDYLTNKSFFVTDAGLCGLGPGTMRIEDELCVFRGARLPSILYGPYHDLTDTGRIFRKYRGEAFVPDIMHGEVESQPERFARGWEMIELR